jgi:hypothetical protein
MTAPQGHLILMMLDWNDLKSGRHSKPLKSLSTTEITEEMGKGIGLTPSIIGQWLQWFSDSQWFLGRFPEHASMFRRIVPK